MIRNSKKLIGVLMVAVLVLGLASAAIADPVTISGKIVQSDDQYLLDTGEKQILLSGDIDEDMVNQEFNVTGTMGTDDNGKEVLTVESVESK